MGRLAKAGIYEKWRDPDLTMQGIFENGQCLHEPHQGLGV